MKIYEVFSELDPKYKQIANNPWIIRLEFNRREMINKKITMEDVNLIIQHHIPHANIVFADDNAGKMVFRMRLDFESNVNNADDDINLLIKEIEKIKDITIKGIDGIQNVYCSKNVNRIIKENNIYKTVTEHYLITNGSNLMEILTKPYVDATRTTTIDVNEAYSVLGVEAARWLLENQFHEVFNSQSKNVCPRHIGLVCDLMTCKGKIMAANRNGINHSDIGPFAKISFEETIRQLKEAGLFGKYDHMTGVSSNIMFGQIPACGTGDSEILLDEDVIAAYVKDHPNVLEAIDDTAETPDDVEGAFGTNTYCDENRDIEFNFNAIEGDVLDLEDLPNVRAGF
jgi:DNA-directed RNA polymerase II subunit RPB1